MRKFKRILRFSIKPLGYLLLAAACVIGGYNIYNEGRYFAHNPKCKYETVLAIDGKTDLYAVVQYDSNIEDTYYIEKGMSCKDFDKWEESNKLENVFGVSGVLYVILGILLVVGTIVDVIAVLLIVVIPVLWLICFIGELWDDKVIGWINRGEPNKKYKDQ